MIKLKEIISDFLENFIVFFLFLICFSVVFFIPNNTFVMQSKQYFIVGAALFLLIFWTAWALINKRFIFVGKKLTYILPLLFTLAVLISSIFSKYQHGSFWGNDSWSNSFVSIASIVIIFLVSINYIKQARFKSFLFIFLALISISQIVFLLFITGLVSSGFFPPNLIGQNISLGFISVLSLITSVGLISHYLLQKKSLLQLILLSLMSVVSLIALFIINLRPLWISAAIGILIICIFQYLRFKSKKSIMYIAPAVVLLICIIFISIGRLNIVPQAESELLPNYKTSLAIAKGSFLDNPFLGVGINNYSIAYNSYRPVEINKTPLFSESFFYSYTRMFDLWSTGGLLVLLSYLAVLIYLGFVAASNSIHKKSDSFLWPLAAAWLIYAIGGFLFMSNILVDLFSWFLMAGIIIMTWKMDRRRKISQARKISVVIIAAILLFVSTFALGLSVKRFVSAQAYYQARKNSFDINLQPQIEEWIQLAARWDKNNDLYHRQLAKIYIAQLTNLLAVNPGENQLQSYEKQLEEVVRKANESAQQAVEVNSDNYLNHIVMADFYLTSKNLATNSLPWAKTSIENAIQAFPNNVYLINELAKRQLEIAGELSAIKNNLEQQNQQAPEIENEINLALNAASDNAQRAISLKSDYLPAYYTLALIELESGNYGQASSLLEELRLTAPNDIGILFYLALSYENLDDYEKSIELIEQTIELAPNFSDGYWALARIYHNLGQTGKAKEYLVKILEYDPNNIMIMTALENINAGFNSTPEIINIEE